MTSAELIQGFKIGLDKTDSLNYPNFLDNEILYFLNQAQDRLIKQRYGINNLKRQSFEETQKRTDDLKELIRNSISSPLPLSLDNKLNGRFFQLPNSLGLEYWFAIQEEADITYLDCHNNSVTDRIMVRPINHDDFNKFTKDAFNKPDAKDWVLRLMYEDKAELITDGTFNITSYILRYIKKPLLITLTQTCELSEHIHQELIDEAVKVALENIQAPRLQSNIAINNQNE